MTAKEVMKLLKENGWIFRRVRGSHHVFVKEGCRSIPVPVHGSGDMGKLAKVILKQAGIN